MLATQQSAARLADPTFQERLLRGDTQIIGRHAVALQAAYPLNESLHLGCLALCSPADGSGVVAPSLRWDLNDTVSLLLTAYLPWGQKPSAGRLESEYGGTPHTVQAQLSLYY